VFDRMQREDLRQRIGFALERAHDLPREWFAHRVGKLDHHRPAVDRTPHGDTIIGEPSRDLTERRRIAEATQPRKLVGADHAIVNLEDLVGGRDRASGRLGFE